MMNHIRLRSPLKKFTICLISTGLTQKIKLPATIKFADDFAYLIKEGIEEEVIGPPL